MRINIPFFTRYIRYFLLFRTYIGNRFFNLIALSVVASLIEGIGFTLFFPLLEMESASPQTSNNLSVFIDSIFRLLHLEMKFTNILILLVFVFFLKSISSFALEAYRAHLFAQVVRGINNGLVSAYSKMNYSYYLQQNTGFLNNVVTVESATAVGGFNRFCQVTSVMVTSIAFLSLSAYINWRFTVFALAIGLTISFFLRFIFRISEKLSHERSDTRGVLQALLIQSLQSFKYLISTARFEQLQVKLSKTVNHFAGLDFKLQLAGAVPIFIEPLVITSVVMILYYQVSVLGQSLPSLMVSILVFYRAVGKISEFQKNWQSFCGLLGGVETVSKTMQESKNVQEITGSISFDCLHNRIELQQVYFAYEQIPVIQDLRLAIQKNTSVALVGASGSGKSTLVDLITGIIQPTQGKILIDGSNIQDLNSQKYRNRIGYVTQESVVFDDTIANNISLWDTELSEYDCREKIQQVAKQALCDEFIGNMSDSYDTIIGDRGIKLSGGQRQRLAIARELFKNPEILILDEATSALDSESEYYIQESIDTLQGKVTIVIIAHRLSTIQNCTQICVLDQGTIVEQGTFSELITKKGSKFKQMCNQQNITETETRLPIKAS